MKTATNYKNIVFDMGNVLVDFAPDSATRRFTDDEQIVREVHNILFYSKEWLALDLGSMTEDKALSRILPRLSSDKVRDIAKAAFEHWHEYGLVKRHGVAELIAALKARGQKIYILSNAASRLAKVYKAVLPATELYDGVLFSGEVLALKPQPLIYQIFFERFNLAPSDCFFIDDLQANVDAAIKCGMDAWQFTTGDVADLKKILQLA